MVAAIFGAVTVGDGAPAAKAVAATAGEAPKKEPGEASDNGDAASADAQALVASLFFAQPAAVQPQQAATGAPVDATATGDKTKTTALAAATALPADAAAGDAEPNAEPDADQPAVDQKSQRLALGQDAAPATKAIPATPGEAPATPTVPVTPAAAQRTAAAAVPAATAVEAVQPQAQTQVAAAVETAEVPTEPVAPAPLADKPKTTARVEPGQTAAAALDQAPPADAEEAPRPLTPVAGANAKVADKPSEGPPAAAQPDVAVARREDGPRAPDALPQAASTAAAAPPPQHTATAVIRGAPETVASLAADIVKKLDGQSTRFDVQLDPAGLGKVDVRIEIGAQGRLTASLTFDNPQAAAELRGRSGELHRALEQAGFDTSGGLSFTSGGDQGQSGQFLAQHQQQQQQGDPGGWRGRAFQAALDVAGEASDGAIAGSLQLQRRSDTGVDIRI